jgi:hypothetical protein
MKKILWFVIAAMVLLTSCGATMRVRGTAPSMDNDGTCAVPLLYPMPAVNPALKIHFAWTGPVSGEDSLAVTPGAPFTFQRSSAPGTYSVRVWATDAGGVGCDTTITTVVKGKPDKPRMEN